jgi:RNA polymerase sigma factor (sigma-70 family)
MRTIDSPFDETRCVSRARNGDDDAFLELVNCFDLRIFRLAKQITQSDADAEEVLIETFLEAYSHLDDLQNQTKFSVWLMKIAVNVAFRRLGDISVRQEQPPSGTDLTPMLDRAMHTLEPMHRAVFALKDIEELSVEDTAEAVSLPPAEVSAILLRARLQLRDQLIGLFSPGTTGAAESARCLSL